MREKIGTPTHANHTQDGSPRREGRADEAGRIPMADEAEGGSDGAGFDPLSSTLSGSTSVTALVELGSAAYLNDLATKAAQPIPMGSTPIVAYTFVSGPMGILLEDSQGGTRVRISEVIESSQAQRMNVPVGGIIMKVNGRRATGRNKSAVGKWLIEAERPLTLLILHPGGSAAAVANLTAVAEADDPFAVPYKAPINSPALQTHPGAGMGPISEHTFPEKAIGITEFHEIEEGVVVVAVAPGSSASSVPVGGIVVAVNNEEARLQRSGLLKQMANAQRPMTLLIAAAPPVVTLANMRRQSEESEQTKNSSSGAVQAFTFEQGALGMNLDGKEGGGVVISSVSGATEALGVPVGGLLVRVNATGVSGLSKQAIGKVLAKAARPVTLFIRQGPSAAAAAAAAAEAAAAAAAASSAAPETATSKVIDQSKVGKKTSRKASITGTPLHDASAAATSRKSKKSARKGKAPKSARTEESGHSSSSKQAWPERREWGDRPSKFEPTATVKHTFGPGPLGLGLSDAPAGGVVITEVAQSSAASELGIQLGSKFLTLNGSDVTGHGKLSLGKMIGYLPRPLVITLLPPPLTEAEPEKLSARDASGSISDRASGKSNSAKPGLKRRKSARTLKKEKDKATADNAEKAAAVVAIQQDAVPVSSQEISEGPSASSAMPGVAAEPDEVLALDANALPSVASAMDKQEQQKIADDEDEDEDEEVIVEVHGNADAPGTAADEQASDESALPTGASMLVPEVENGEQPGEEDDAPKAAPPTLLMPQRAHPPPTAPLEAFPAWATRPPVRSPRHVKGTAAKYVLKPTAMAFSHPSLTAPAADSPPQPSMLRKQSTASHLATTAVAAPALVSPSPAAGEALPLDEMAS